MLHKLEIVDDKCEVSGPSSITTQPLEAMPPLYETSTLPGPSNALPIDSPSSLPDVFVQTPEITENICDPRDKVAEEEVQCRVSRSGRLIKPIVRLDL